ncbi:ER membrane protein complex subunit 3 [Dorcoceras hygrometricum]|uniref:ER membrane protein complex subunit 3 n=1 Tax=Dorcoceras hygrometricum TaxID=472368 RepID=A0A2Z7A6F6_9LAMI|nr:ER membrane protein complex subunit 3 [Dorcoceras hygrometricum]
MGSDVTYFLFGQRAATTSRCLEVGSSGGLSSDDELSELCCEVRSSGMSWVSSFQRLATTDTGQMMSKVFPSKSIRCLSHVGGVRRLLRGHYLACDALVSFSWRRLRTDLMVILDEIISLILSCFKVKRSVDRSYSWRQGNGHLGSRGHPTRGVPARGDSHLGSRSVPERGADVFLQELIVTSDQEVFLQEVMVISGQEVFLQELRQSGPRPDPRLLRQTALEVLTRSARSDNTIIPLDSIGYPRMSASGESSTTMHRLLHASGSHPIPTPDDSKSDGREDIERASMNTKQRACVFVNQCRIKPTSIFIEELGGCCGCITQCDALLKRNADRSYSWMQGDGHLGSRNLPARGDGHLGTRGVLQDVSLQEMMVTSRQEIFLQEVSLHEVKATSGQEVF